jgi:hypothetical protein
MSKKNKGTPKAALDLLTHYLEKNTMTVKELKKALKGVPDNVEVTALKDGAYCERTEVWAAHWDNYEEKDEDGEIYKVNQFTINC